MKAQRLLIERSIIMECCDLRAAAVCAKYNCEYMHDVILEDNNKDYHCGLFPCLHEDT